MHHNKNCRNKCICWGERKRGRKAKKRKNRQALGWSYIPFHKNYPRIIRGHCTCKPDFPATITLYFSFFHIFTKVFQTLHNRRENVLRSCVPTSLLIYLRFLRAVTYSKHGMLEGKRQEEG